MRWLIDWLDRLFPKPMEKHSWLHGTEGEGLTEYQIGQRLLAMTQLSGWALLKGNFNKLVITHTMDHGDDKKNPEYTRGISKGLSLGLKALWNIERTDLNAVLEDQRREDRDREARERRQQRSKEVR